MNQAQTGPVGSRRTTLPTSRLAPQQERGMLAVLRSMAPRRRLQPGESLILAELQANRLIELAGQPQPPMPNELITELPRIVVNLDPDLPVSGSAHWGAGRWQITINSREPWARQRFSMAHELKHCIDHPFVEVLYGTDRQREATADFFAACLLMPKREVKRAWGEGAQRLSDLAAMFAVSPAAMGRRLEHLGLRPALPLEATPPSPPRQRGHYTRRSSNQPLGASP